MNAVSVFWLRLRWLLLRLWAGCSVFEMLGLALLTLALGLAWQVNMPLKNTLAQRQTDVSGQRLALQRQTQPGHTSAPAPTLDAIAGFVKFLPPQSEREQQLKTLHDLATAQGLALGRVDYHGEAVPSLAADRLSLRFSVQGPYPVLRQFLHSCLSKLPSLAVTRIGLEKGDKLPDAMVLSVEASLYLQQPVQAP